MLKRCGLALALSALVAAPPARAQENATLILRSGERIAGQLLDHGGVGFTIRVNGEERRVPTNDVAVVDFAGGDMSAADWAKLSGSAHLVWLRNGETISGEFSDISGTAPLQITIKTSSGDRRFASNEISRIVLARTNDAVATSGTSQTTSAPSTTQRGGIVVPANRAWTQAGIRVRSGEWVAFDSTGEIRLTTDPADIASPSGAASNRTAEKAPIPSAPIGTLIGRIGDGQPFVIGNQTRVQMPAAGVLFLGINDDHLADNAGDFRVQVTGGAR
jgi:hypothetical protein